MEQVDQLIHAETIITCEDNNQILQDHALAVKDAKIHAILPSSEASKKYECTNVLNLPTHVVMPGFVNCHTHLAMNVFRGLADDLNLMDWLHNYIWPAEKKYVDSEMVYEASQLAIAEMIRCGTTCFNDMYFFPQDTARAAIEAGVYANIGMTIIDVPTQYAQTNEEYFEKGLAFYHEYKNHPLVRATLAPHSTYMVSLKSLERVNVLAQELNLKINIHLQEDPEEIVRTDKLFNMRPLAWLDKIGMVSERLIAVHMTQVNEADLAILAAKRPNIVHCPQSNMKLDSGLSPVQQFLSMGLNVALATDGAASNNDLNMLGEMRTAAFLGKIAAHDPKAVNTASVMKMATLNGARALGLDKITGSLTPGKSADFIAIEMNELETQPNFHPESMIVYAASRHQVTDVWCAGRRLMKNRELQTLDEKELLKKAKAWREKITI